MSGKGPVSGAEAAGTSPRTTHSTMCCAKSCPPGRTQSTAEHSRDERRRCLLHQLSLQERPGSEKEFKLTSYPIIATCTECTHKSSPFRLICFALTPPSLLECTDHVKGVCVGRREINNLRITEAACKMEVARCHFRAVVGVTHAPDGYQL